MGTHVVEIAKMDEHGVLDFATLQLALAEDVRIPENDAALDPRSQAEQMLDRPSLAQARDSKELARRLELLNQAITEKVVELGLEFAFGDDLGIRLRIPERGFPICRTDTEKRPMFAAYSFVLIFTREE